VIRRHQIRTRAARLAPVLGAAAVPLLGGVLGGCSTSPLESIPTESSVVVTEYVTLPPPTTTIPPTTTLPPEPGSVLTSEATYVIVEGDYPFVVANRFGVDFKEFVELNGWEIVDGQVPDWPAPGTTIRIPAGATVPGGPSVLVPVPTTTTTLPPGVLPVPSSEPPAETTTTVDDGIGCGTYTVAEGDYKLLVADKLNTTVDALDAANADTDGYGAFYVGLKLNVPC
jgi:hypothetical protein